MKKNNFKDFTPNGKPSIGELLRKKREEKKLKLEEVTNLTHISIKYLQAMENEDWKVFPAEVYLFGFLKQYSKFLGLNPEEIINTFKEKKQAEETKLIEQEQQKLYQLQQIKTKRQKIFVTILLILLLTISILISYFKYFPKNFKKKPYITKKINIQEEKIFKELLISTTLQSWIKIVADNTTVFEGILPENKTISAKATNFFYLKVGYKEGVIAKLDKEIINLNKYSHGSVAELTIDLSKPHKY